MKRRYLVDRDVDDREVHSLVLMDQDVPQSGYVLPRDLRRPLA